MATLNKTRALFFVTSPRTPFKMIPEIDLLQKSYSGVKWNTQSQEAFAKELSNAPFFKGQATLDSAFSARDRINRAPKALGFVNLSPHIELTKAGKVFLESSRPHEIFTRQLLKFQLPSPYHTDPNSVFAVKPYLELLRLIYELGSITKEEIQSFALQITKYDKYDMVKNKILKFRQDLKNLNRSKVSYKQFINQVVETEILEIYKDDINTGNIKTRESSSMSLAYFIKTKKSNHRDYADAAFRYLRATELVTLVPRTFALKISPEKISEVIYILNTIDRNPLEFVEDQLFKDYLFNPEIPELLTDNKENLKNIITYYISDKTINLNSLNIEQLKNLKETLINERRELSVKKQTVELKTYNEFEDIIEVYKAICKKSLVDSPLMMEWNTWRAFTMLDDGNIIGNFRVDDEGMPLSTAQGNMSDIVCEYNTFDMNVEVTLSTGQKQYEMEGEPVARHLAKLKRGSTKDTFCIFIAPNLNDAALAHFYSLHKISISYYGGKSKIIPMQLDTFIEMLKCANNSPIKPNSTNLINFLEYITDKAVNTNSEEEWYDIIKNISKEWVSLKIVG